MRKWSCSDQCVLESIPIDLRDSQATVILSHSDQYTKTLVIEWINASYDHFRVNVTELPPIECMTKRSLVSDVAKTFGWYSPTIVKAKILLQALWLEEMIVSRIQSWQNGLSGDESCHCFQPITLTVLLPQRSCHTFYPVAWLLRCLRKGLLGCRLPQNGRQ